MNRITARSILSQDGFWMLNKSIVRALKGHIPALVLSELVARDSQFQESPNREDDDWFFFQVERIEEELMIGRDARRSAFKILVDFGILEIERRGVPSKYYYKINYGKIDQIISETFKRPLTTEAGSPLSGEVEQNPSGEVATPPSYIKNKEKELKEINNTTSEGKPDTFREDPFIKRYIPEKVDLVYQIINEFFIKEYNVKCKPDKPYCSEIVAQLIAEDEDGIRKEINEKILQFRFHPWWSEKFRPSPKHLYKAWEMVDPKHVPEYARKGFQNISDYNNQIFSEDSEELPTDLETVELLPKSEGEKIRDSLFKKLQ